jgi:hypothetical protein
MTGQVYVTATAFGGPAGESWAVTTQRWPCPAKPTLVPATVLLAAAGASKAEK